MWITATRDAVAKAVRQKVFARGFRQAVEVEAGLAETIEFLLRRAALQDLALAKKAGCVVSGFAKVEKALSGRTSVVLLHASDAGSDGRRKLDRQMRARVAGDMSVVAPVGWFTSAEVSAALGRENVMHAAIENGGAGRGFLRSAERFGRYVGTHQGAAITAAPPEQDKE